MITKIQFQQEKNLQISDYSIKMLILGDEGVGKTTFAKSYNNFQIEKKYGGGKIFIISE